MKIHRFREAIIIAILLLANQILLFSQASKPQDGILSSDAKCPVLIVSPSNQNVTAPSGTTSFSVTSNVSWISSSNQSWCTVTSSGTRNGTIQVTYQENTGPGSRIAVITVSASGVRDQVVTVTQLGSAPALIVTPQNQNVPSSSGTTSFSVASNVPWNAVSDQAWCTVTASGSGNGSITAAYLANAGTGTRVATIKVSGTGVNDQLVTVTQLGTGPALIVTPLNQNVPSSSGTTGFSITSNVTWTASSDQAWCTVTPSGSGNGTLTAEYDANTGAVTRIATITVSGSGTIKQLVTVTQSGTAPVLTVTPQNRDVTYPAGETTFDVVSNIEWTSSSDQAWCTVLPSGTGNGIITASYGEQTATTSRTATITISGPGVNSQIVTVTQSGVPPTLLVTPPNQYVASSPGTAGFDVASNTDWSASSDQDWCIVTGSGSGNGTITAAFEANTTPLVRVANITVTGQGANDQVVTITQDELITISYSDSPWCPSGDLQNVILSGTPGGIYSAEPDGLGIDPATGDIDPAISAAGSYTVKYTLEKSQGNRVIEAVTGVAIRVTFTPQIAIKWDDVLICPNLDNAILSYQWYKDSSPIAGATGQYYVTSRIQGSYSVEVEETNGCKVMSDAINMGSAKAAVIYPNPVRSTFKISLGDVPEGKVQIRITDMAGNEVMHLDTERSGAEYEKEIPAGQLENGLYSVQITVNGISMYFAKIMVIK